MFSRCKGKRRREVDSRVEGGIHFLIIFISSSLTCLFTLCLKRESRVLKLNYVKYLPASRKEHLHRSGCRQFSNNPRPRPLPRTIGSLNIIWTITSSCKPIPSQTRRPRPRPARAPRIPPVLFEETYISICKRCSTTKRASLL